MLSHIICCCGLMVSASLSAGQYNLSSSDLVAILLTQSESLAALSVVYTEEPRARHTGPEGAYVRRRVAARGPKWFLRDNAHGHNRLNWESDPIRKTLLVTPSRSTLLENLNQVVIDIDNQGDLAAPFDVRGELLFYVLCWWPFDAWQAPMVFGRPWSMKELLASGKYVRRNDMEEIDSRRCYVLEVPHVDVMWVDSDNPACVLRRDIYNTDTTSVAARFDMREFIKVADSIWVPSIVRNRQFDSYAHSADLRNALVVDASFAVTDVKVNSSVGSETFALEYKPGAIKRVVSGDTINYEVVRDGEWEHFGEILKWAKSASQQEGRQIDDGGRLVDLGAVIVGICCGIMLSYALPTVILRQCVNRILEISSRVTLRRGR